MFIPPLLHPHRVFQCQVWTRNESCSSYCNEFDALQIFLIFLRFEQGSGFRTLLRQNGSNGRIYQILAGAKRHQKKKKKQDSVN